MTVQLAVPQPRILPPDAPLLANMAALWATDAPLARRLETLLDADPYPTEPSRAHLPTLSLPTPDGRRLYLHSRHQPLDEARRLVDALPLDEHLLFCVHGFGLGYHIEHLFQQASPDAIVLVLEPDLRLLRTAFERSDFSRFIEANRLLFLDRPDNAALLQRLGNRQALVAAGVAILSHPPSLQLHPDFHRAAGRSVAEFVDFCRTSMNTLLLNGRRTAENIARNLPWYVAASGIGRLKDRHRGQPALIVSAGPSLRKNRHLLRDAAGHAVIIAVQTTLQPLLDLGLQPDYVTSLDYHDICTRFFEKLPRPLDTELVAEPKASSAIFNLYPGPVSLLGNEFADKLLREMRLDRPRLRSGATVAHLAFYLAEYLACDPIIFVGQDLGFSDGLAYMPGTSYEDVWRPELGRFCTVEMKQWEHIARERPILRRISDWNGNPMYTEERLFVYLQQFERDFAMSRARIIDATEGGAMKRGATPLPLAAALEQYCRQPLPPIPNDHPGRQPDRLAEAASCLRLRKSEASQIAQIARETLALLDELHACVEDQPRANRIIARIDALRARLVELDDTYQLVTDLAQNAQIRRFQADHRISASRATGIDLQRRQIARDIPHVRCVLEAAEQFQALIDDVLSRFVQ